MSIKVDSGYSAFFSVSRVRDTEWQQIIDRLWNKYGIRSTGSKSADKAKLHELELKEAEQLNGECSCGRFLTIQKNELDKIKEKKKKKDIKRNPEKHPEVTQGAEILGKQILLAIQMKGKDDADDNKKKRDNKYQS